MRTAYDAGMAKAASVMGIDPHMAELVGLGILGAIPAHHLISHMRGVEEDPEVAGPTDAALDLVGLGALALPTLAEISRHGA